MLGNAGVGSFSGNHRWHTPSLQELSSNTTVPLNLNSRRHETDTPPSQPNKLFNSAARRSQKSDIGIQMRAGKARASVPTAKSRTHRTPKPSSQPKPQDRGARLGKIDDSKDHHRKPVGPGPRFGASKATPMLIDDEEDEMDGLYYEALLRAQRKIPSCGRRAPSIYSPQFRTSTPPQDHTPRRDVFAPRESFLARFGEAGAERRVCDGSFYTSCRPLDTDESAESPSTRRTHTCQSHARRHPPERQDEEVVTLGDIADFDTRQNVATLMAVAPRLEVRDLYHLLIDMKGDMPAAREQATIRASCAPPSRPFVKREQTSAVPAAQNVIDLADSDSDDVMIKIDPNAPFLEYDTDTPPPEEPVRAKKPAAARKRQAQPNSNRKRTKSVAVRHRRYRENSINDFVAENGTVYYATDGSSSTDSESGVSDVPNGDDSDEEKLEPEKLEDLRIELRSKYVYNAHILGNKRKKG